MTPVEIVSKYDTLGVRLWASDGQLHFKAPADILHQEHISELKENKEALIFYLESLENVDVTPDPESRFEPFPVTDVQAAYLVGRTENYEFGGVGCHGYVELSMPTMEHARLEKAWQAVLERHDMLRAVVMHDGSQKVLEEIPPVSIAYQDLTGIEDADAQRQLLVIRDSFATKQYAPDSWPLCELALTQMDHGSVLHCSIDMLIADFVSVDIMLSELDVLYHEPADILPEPEISFRDVILFEKRQRETPSFVARREQDKEYWLERMNSLPDSPDLPILANHPQSKTVLFSRHSFTLDSEKWTRFGASAKANRLTPSCAVLSAFAEIISRWSRQPSFCLNVTQLNRAVNHPQIDKVIGDFTDVNLLEVTTVEEASFAHRAQNIQNRLWEDMEHTAYSGVEVLRELGRQRDSRVVYPVVYTSMLGLGDPARHDGEFMRQASLSYGISQTPQVWIDCQVSERGGQLHLNWDVRDGVFPEGMIEEAFVALQALLLRLADDASLWSVHSPLVLPADLIKGRLAANATMQDLPPRLLHEGFWERVQKTPEQPALISQGRTYSYEELADMAAVVQTALQEVGCGPNDIVAVIQPKSAWQIASVLGVLFSGAAYVPIDIDEPIARRDTILENAHVQVVLSQETLSSASRKMHCIDVSLLDLGKGHPLELHSQDTDDLAYVIYTSGTTGTPKGVMMTHAATQNTLADLNQRFDMTHRDVILGVANLNFDLSVFDIFGGFFAGATVVLPDQERRNDPGHWFQLMVEHTVTIWNSVPAQLHMLMTFLEGEVAPKKDLSLRLAMLSGDWISPALPTALRQYCPDALVMSLGGATEAAIWSIGYAIPRNIDAIQSIPYGTPLANQTFYVLDTFLQPSPNWVAGNLYIGGVGLAKGYLGDVERTNERFCIHPETGERLYKTGDLGRYRPDGVIEFLGREDTQVKIRGHRIELGEVESVIRSHPGVATAVALTTDAMQQHAQLVAFVEASQATKDVSLDTQVWERLSTICIEAGDSASTDIDRTLLTRWVQLSNQIALLGMIEALRKIGLFSDMESSHTYLEILQLGKVSEKNQRLMRRWLAALHCQNLLSFDQKTQQYSLAVAPPDAQALPTCWEELDRVEEELHYGRALINYLKLSAEHLPQLLQGDTDPLDLLFPQGSLDTAVAAYNENLVSKCMNVVVRESVVALALERQKTGQEPLRVLELGAGVGGITRDLLSALDGLPVTYHFTDISPFFLNEAQNKFAAYPWVTYGQFDINQPYWEQGYSAGTFDVIICGLMLHNAINGPAVLERLKESAVPGGILLVIESTDDMYSLLTSMEFKEGLTGFTDVRAHTEQTFFSREQWKTLFKECGAELVGQYPSEEDALSKAGQSLFAVRFPSDKTALKVDELRSFVSERLPHYMVPNHFEVMPSMPLSANGKIERKALLNRLRLTEKKTAHNGEKPHDGLETQIAAIWETSLNRDSVGRHEDFFAAGGDSLLIAQVVVKIREAIPEAQGWEWDKLMAEVLQEPTVAAVAAKLASQKKNEKPQTKPLGSTVLSGNPLAILAPGPNPKSPMRVLVHTGNGNLASYRHIMPELIAEPNRQMALAGLSVSDYEGFLQIPEEHLIEELGRHYAQSILDSGTEQVELIGYCSGGLIALEIARVLLEAGMDIAPLRVINSGPFQYRIQDELLMERAFGRLFGVDMVAAGHYPDEDRFAAAISSGLDDTGNVIPSDFLVSLQDAYADVGEWYKPLSQMDQSARLAAIAAALPDAKGKATEYQLGMIKLLYSIFNHTFISIAHYKPTSFVHDVRLYLPKDSSMHAIPGVRSEVRELWEDITLGNLDVRAVPGNHVTCVQPPLVGDITKNLLMKDVS